MNNALNPTKGSAPLRWADDFLDQMRVQGDVLADEVIAATFAHGDIKTTNELMKRIVSNDDLVPEELPDEIEFFLRDNAVLPEWADHRKLLAGQQLFFRYGIQVISVLIWKSLPFCYAAADGAQVLHFSERIKGSTGRRVLETSQFVIDVMSPGAFDKGSRGIRSCQKVRLMHAAVRYHLKQGNRWNYAWGSPINQEDMAGTNLAFSLLVLEGLKQIGVDFDYHEEEAYMHTWDVIGYLLGLHESLRPKNMAEAEAFKEILCRRHHKPSEAGTVLTAALVEFLKDAIPGQLFDGYVESYMRFLNGNEMSDMLGVKKADWTKVLIKPMKLINSLSDDLGDELKPFARLAGKLSYHVITAVQKLGRGGQTIAFRIPEALDEQWAKGLKKY